MGSKVLHVDFKARKVVRTESLPLESKVQESSNLDMSNFEIPPKNTNFAFFTDEERYLHSEHILKYLHEIDFEDQLHFVRMGVLDKKKLALKLGVSYPV